MESGDPLASAHGCGACARSSRCGFGAKGLPRGRAASQHPALPARNGPRLREAACRADARARAGEPTLWLPSRGRSAARRGLACERQAGAPVVGTRRVQGPPPAGQAAAPGLGSQQLLAPPGRARPPCVVVGFLPRPHGGGQAINIDGLVAINIWGGFHELISWDSDWRSDMAANNEGIRCGTIPGGDCERCCGCEYPARRKGQKLL